MVRGYGLCWGNIRERVTHALIPILSSVIGYADKV
jgi:hypothetical protein